MIAVRDTGEAMKAYWNGDKTSDPVSVAKKYLVHPKNSPENISKKINTWSKNNLARIVRSESKTDAGHYYDQTKEDLKLLKESIKESHKQIEVLFNRFF